MFFGFGVEGVIGQVMGVEVGFDGLEIRLPLVMSLVPFLVLGTQSFV
jgi:hypothetical protein